MIEELRVEHAKEDDEGPDLKGLTAEKYEAMLKNLVRDKREKRKYDKRGNRVLTRLERQLELAGIPAKEVDEVEEESDGRGVEDYRQDLTEALDVYYAAQDGKKRDSLKGMRDTLYSLMDWNRAEKEVQTDTVDFHGAYALGASVGTPGVQSTEPRKAEQSARGSMDSA